jgi:hypothetical protein
MFVSCFLYGGLGNQLFQIFTAIAYSMKHCVHFKFMHTEHLGKRPVYWRSFLKGLVPYLSTDIDPDAMYKITQKDDYQLEAPQNTPVILDGYFQSPVFFEEYYLAISTLTGIARLQDSIFAKFIETYSSKFCISMHFRRGDYKELQHIHPIMPTEYYENALAYITAVNPRDRYTVIYFCEDEDEDAIINTDIAILESSFPNCVFRRFVGESDWEEMLYMSCCSGHIIANSSFSWWGAYMDRRDNTVCYPGKWFGNAAFPDTMFPSQWTKIAW